VETPQPSLPPPLRAELARLGLSFMADILEIETGRHPENVDALAELGHIYTRQKRYALGLAVDQKLVRLVPDNPTVHYNLACSLAILGEKEGALDALERAVRLGYDDPAFMQQDEDLRRLRQESRFIELVRRLEEARG
jgi:tetratricopeptide (TPR) repeat protein